MALRIEDYAIIGDTQTAALVGRDGSIDWLCLPAFNSGACFSALLGDRDNGRWLIAPASGEMAARRSYRGDSLILETEFDTPTGSVRIVDFMPPRGEVPDVVRIVEGISGRVDMAMDLVIRFEYGMFVPWVRHIDGETVAVAGPDSIHLRSPVEVRGENLATKAEFTVAGGESLSFVMCWHSSYSDNPPMPAGPDALADTEAWWSSWMSQCQVEGPEAALVRRSLLTLKALTYAPTGGIVAAATTSLPEDLGGERNWDYRFCWLRDATFTLSALLNAGFETEAMAWRDWLLRAVAGAPAQLQILYGPAGERRLTESEIPWLAGYEGSQPVRVGNAAADQVQLDVFGEVMDTLDLARGMGLPEDPAAWQVQVALLDHLEAAWREPDNGIWEVRGEPRHFTHSKVMAWVAFDRAVKAVDRHGLDGPRDRWAEISQEIHAEVCQRAVDARGVFTQSYGSSNLDASVLMIPLVGFLPASDPRMIATVDRSKGEPMTPASSSTVWPGWPTTWACSARSTTSVGNAWSGTSPRPSPTSRWSTPLATSLTRPSPSTGVSDRSIRPDHGLG